MSCLETYATLRINSQSMNPQRISELLGIEATKALPIDPAAKYRHRREWHLWRWSTQTLVESRDNLEHVQAIIDLLDGKAQQIADLRAQGCHTDIFCYWISSGQGGPTLDRQMMAALADLGLDISWDMYFGDQADYNTDGLGKSPSGE